MRPDAGRRLLAASALTVVVIATAACSNGAAKIPAVAAEVEGAPVAAADVEALTTRYLQSGTTDSNHSEIPVGDGRRLVLGYLIRFSLLKHLASKAGVGNPSAALIEEAVKSVSPTDLASEGVTPQDLETALQAGELSKRLAVVQFPRVAVADSELRQLYDSVKDHYAQGWSLEARAAFLPSQAAAEQVRTSGVNAAGFDAAAQALGAKVVGSMGTVTNSSTLAPSVIDALAKTPSGQMTEAIPASDGWLVFFVETRQEVAGQSFDEARSDLLAQLEDQKRQRLFDNWFEEQVKKARISVDPFFGKWNAESGRVTS